MLLSALLVALAAALLLAFGNLVLGRAGDGQAAAAVVGVASVMVFAPVAVVVWGVEARAWPYLVASSALQLLYFTLLAAAYRRAELSVIYPIARGVAPVLVLAFGVAVAGEGTSPAQVAGVALVALGVLLVRGVRRPAAAEGVVFGLAVAAVIAAYTLVDNEGIRFATPIAYLEVTLLPAVLVYAGAVAALKGRAALRAETNAATLAGGVATFAAYALVLAALQRAPAAPVAAVRETSVVIAAALAGIVLNEHVGRVRLGGAALVVAGIVLVSV